MKKSIIFASLVCAVMLSSCKLAIIPTAINTVNSVSLDEMNLDRKDYIVLNTITAEAAVTYRQFGRTIFVEEVGGECKMVFKRPLFSHEYAYKSFMGIARYGFLSNDYEGKMQGLTDRAKPEYIARNLAIYRLINACKMAGGDGVIEPIISTNVEQSGNRSIIFKTTVSAKVIKIKPDGK